MSEPLATGEVDLFLFEVGGELYGADAAQVLGIVRPQGTAPATPLGQTRSAGRALRVRTGNGVEELAVDGVRGVASVPVSSLRRLPAVARVRPYSIGVWLTSSQAVMLVDLSKLLDPRAPQEGAQEENSP